MASAAAMLAGCAVWFLGVPAHDVPSQAASEEVAADDNVATQPAVAVAAESPESPPSAKEGAAKSTLRAAARTKSGDEEYCDPLSVTKWFITEMSRVTKQTKPVAPTELFRQAKREKRCELIRMPEPAERLSSEAIYARAKPGVVVVGAILQPRGHKHFHAALATGFVIGRNGVIATNFHVLEAFQHAKAVGVMTAERRVYPLKAVLAGDEPNDLAVVKIEAEDLTALPLAEHVSVGAPVWCLSHPALDTEELETAFYAFTQGIVCGKYRLSVGGPNPIDVLAVTAEYAKGSSGGPILDERGAVVGIICQTRALFHDEDQTEPQLTWKFSRPVSSLRALLKTPADVK